MERQSGYLMMVVAVLLVIIAGLATSFVSMTTVGTNSSISTLSANIAFDLANSGIEAGSYQLSLSSANCSSSWSSIVTVDGQGEYQYNCTKNTASTTISSSLTTASTTIPLSSASGFATFGAITIDSETIYYDGISGNLLLNAKRGKNGSSATAHSSGAAVAQSQYIISSQAGAPSLSDPFGRVVLSQAELLNSGTSLYFAAGRNTSSRGVILSYNGTSWSTSLFGPASFSFQGIDASSNYGLAVGYNTGTFSSSSIYQFNGVSWSLSATSNNFLYNSVACDLPGAPTNCWIAGQTSRRFNPKNRPLLYHDGTAYYNPNGSSYLLTGISCKNGLCAAVGQADAYVFSSTTTINPTFSPNNLTGVFNDVDCADATNCLAVQNNGVIYYYDGTQSYRSVLSQGSAHPNLFGVDCPTTSTCFVVGVNGAIFRCSLPATTAEACTLQITPGGLNLSDVSCISTSNCLAVSATVVATAYSYNGSTWKAVTLPLSYSLNSVTNTGGGAGAAGVTLTVLRNQ